MTDYTIAIDLIDNVFDDDNPRPQPSFPTGPYTGQDGTDRFAYCTTTLDGWPDSMILICGHDEQSGLHEGQYIDADGFLAGVVQYPPHPDHDDYLNSLGNDSETGEATGLIVDPIWQGHAQFRMAEDQQLYLRSNTPFVLNITRTYTDDDGFPHIPWGWRVDMISEDPQRDITARAIGVYADPECTQYLYTTGAFHHDGDYDYYTVCPVGQRKADPEPVYFALLSGSTQEGIWHLVNPEEGARERRLFWSMIRGTQSMRGGPDNG